VNDSPQEEIRTRAATICLDIVYCCGHAFIIAVVKPFIYATSTACPFVTTSSAETETVAFTQKLGVAIHLARMLFYMNLIPTEAIVGWQDNQAAIRLQENGGPCSARTRHIDVRWFWAKEFMDEQLLSLFYCRSEDLVVDGLTKPLSGEKFQTVFDAALGLP